MKRPTSDEVRLPLLLGAVTAVLVTALALVSLQSATATYRSTAVVSLDQPLAVAASGDAGVINKLSRLRFKYVGLIGTDRVAAPVAKRLGVPVTQVRGRLVAEARLDDLLIRVSGMATEPAEARRTADAVAAELQALIAAEQKAAKIPAAGQLQVQLIQPAVGAEKVSPRRSRSLAVALAAGLLLGALVGAGLLLARRPSRFA